MIKTIVVAIVMIVVNLKCGLAPSMLKCLTFEITVMSFE